MKDKLADLAPQHWVKTKKSDSTSSITAFVQSWALIPDFPLDASKPQACGLFSAWSREQQIFQAATWQWISGHVQNNYQCQFKMIEGSDPLYKARYLGLHTMHRHKQESTFKAEGWSPKDLHLYPLQNTNFVFLQIIYSDQAGATGQPDQIKEVSAFINFFYLSNLKKGLLGPALNKKPTGNFQ